MKVKKTESTIRPLNFRIGDHKGNLIEVVFFDDIEEDKRTSEDGTEQTVYLYYEYTINIVNRDDIESYINDNYETWLQMAKDNFIASKSAEIRAIRDKLLSESDKQVLIDRLGIEIPETINAATMLNVIKDLFSSLGNILNGDWSKYRQELRDITKQPNFPYDVEFPKLPGETNE